MIEELQEILLDFVIFNFLSEKYYFVCIYIFVLYIYTKLLENALLESLNIFLIESMVIYKI